MKNMRFASAALTVGLLAGCSSEKTTQTDSAPRPTQATVTAPGAENPQQVKATTEQALAASGYKRHPEDGTWIGILKADPRIAELQHTIGIRVMTLLAEAGPLTSTVNGQSRDVVFSMPGPDVLRAVTFVPSSKDVVNVPGIQNIPGSQTRQFLDDDYKLGMAFGAVSQEAETMISDAAAEYCQAMDMKPVEGGFNPDEKGVDYIRHKEGVCNSAALLADTAFIGAGYPVYTSRIAGRRLQGPAAHGADIPYPVLPEPLYDRAAANLRAK